MAIHYSEYQDRVAAEWKETTSIKGLVTCLTCRDIMAREEQEEQKKAKEEHMPAKTFYLVMIDAADLPRKRYDNFDDAIHAAERLLSEEKNQGKGVYILRAVKYGKAQYSPVSWKTLG